MANQVTVTIDGTEYTLVSEESPSYMQKVASLVDGKMIDIAFLPGAERVIQLAKASGVYEGDL